MKRILAVAAVIIATAATAPLSAQQTRRPFESELRFQDFIFGNFFQAANGTPTQDVNAVGADYRGIYNFPVSANQARTSAYGEANLMKYTNIQRQRPNGVRVGLKSSSPVREYDFYIDRGGNRAAFDVGQRTAIATITTFSGDYYYRILPKLDVGAEVEHQRQRFNVESTLKNNYTRGGPKVRYQGFGSVFVPQAGYIVGNRDVEDRVDSYHERYWFVGASSELLNYKLYLSLDYNHVDRSYSDVGGLPNVRPDEARPQISGVASYRINPRFGTLLYFSREQSRSQLPSANFHTSFVLLGLVVHM